MLCDAKDDRRLLGARAERLAAWYLRLHGWSIVARNLRVGGVEIDLLARKGATEALIEVKSRRSGLFTAAELVSPGQRRRLRRALALRAGSSRLRGVRAFRIDVVEVRLQGWFPRVQHHPGLVPPESPGEVCDRPFRE